MNSPFGKHSRDMRKPIRTVGLGTDRHRRYQNSKLSLSLSCSSELFSLTNTKLIILSHQTLTLVTATINVSLRQSSNTTTPLIVPPQALIFNATALIIFDLRPTFFLCFDMFFLWVLTFVTYWISICGCQSRQCQFVAMSVNLWLSGSGCRLTNASLRIDPRKIAPLEAREPTSANDERSWCGGN